MEDDVGAPWTARLNGTRVNGHRPEGGPPRSALVTGGAGFIGSHLCERLLERGVRVVCLDNLATGRAANVAHLDGGRGFRFMEGDVADDPPDPGPVDAVFHLASAASPKDYARLPLETLDAGGAGTCNALRIAEEYGARMVLASTSEVYGDPLQYPQREEYRGNVDPVGPRSAYDEAKRYAEALTAAHVRARGTDAGIARIFNSYGPRMRPDDGRAVPTFVRQALEGRPITVAGDGLQTRSLCYVDDTVQGLLALAGARGYPGPVNIGSPFEMSMLVLAKLVRDLAGSDSEVEFTGRAPDDPRHRRPDLKRAIEDLAWAPRIGTEEGLRRTIDWFAGELRRLREREAPARADP